MSDDILNKIYEKVEKISEDVGSVKITQAVMAEDVRHHVRRSDMLEDMYTDLKQKDIEPIKADIHQFKGIIKFISYASAIVGVVVGVLKALGKI